MAAPLTTTLADPNRSRARADGEDAARESAPALPAATGQGPPSARVTGAAASILQQALKRQKARQQHHQQQDQGAGVLSRAYLAEVSRIKSTVGADGDGSSKWLAR